MRINYFSHSLLSCWNHGNAHFLRGILRDLVARGHDVRSFEPEDGWSRRNLLEDPQGHAVQARFGQDFPDLAPRVAFIGADVDAMLDGADLVIVHEWTDPALVKAIGARRAAGGRFLLLFHDTHHRAVTDPEAIGALDLGGYDGVLAFGATLAEVYRRAGWGRRVFVWHEAADTRLFRPPPGEDPGDRVARASPMADALPRERGPGSAQPAAEGPSAAHGETNGDAREAAPATQTAQAGAGIGTPAGEATGIERQGAVWIGNWGDGERTEELRSYLLAPVRALGLPLDVYGVRYPDGALADLAAAGATYRGWLPNARAPEIFARHLMTMHVPRRAYATDLPGIPTIRMFEALACGIPLVSAPWSDSEGLFRTGQDYLSAPTQAAMQTALARLRDDPALRADVAASGLETVRARHTCAHRVDELLDIVRRIRNPGSLAPSLDGAPDGPPGGVPGEPSNGPSDRAPGEPSDGPSDEPSNRPRNAPGSAGAAA